MNKNIKSLSVGKVCILNRVKQHCKQSKKIIKLCMASLHLFKKHWLLLLESFSLYIMFVGGLTSYLFCVSMDVGEEHTVVKCKAQLPAVVTTLY